MGIAKRLEELANEAYFAGMHGSNILLREAVFALKTEAQKWW